jgi:hypothetical protein
LQRNRQIPQNKLRKTQPKLPRNRPQPPRR